MRYRYLDDFRRGISVFAIFSYGIAVLGTPQCPPLLELVLYHNGSVRVLIDRGQDILYVEKTQKHKLKTLGKFTAVA